MMRLFNIDVVTGLTSDFWKDGVDSNDGRKGNKWVERNVRMVERFSRWVLRVSKFGGEGNWVSLCSFGVGDTALISGVVMERDIACLTIRSI